MERGPFDEPYAERYAKWSSDAAPDIPFYVGLAQEADGPIVELAVGNGRVAIPVAHATGALWWATKNEWLGLIDVAGLELESLFGGFEGEAFTADSREFVFVTRRPLPPA
jgi:hypothetical protein